MVWNLCAADTTLTTRLALTGSVIYAEPGQPGYRHTDLDSAQSSGDPFSLLTQDQQSVRWILSSRTDAHEWVVHGKLARTRQEAEGLAVESAHRWVSLEADIFHQRGVEEETLVHVWLDQGYWRFQGADYSLTFGRQPIDYGAGRLWQPLNAYGAFQPTDLDRAYKPGVDALVGEYFLSPFSSLQAAVVLGDKTVSGTLKYQGLVARDWNLNLLGGSVQDIPLLGASLEGQWQGMGWRAELTRYFGGREWAEAAERVSTADWFSVLGVDYLFSGWGGDSGLMVVAEWYHHTGGARQQGDLAAVPLQPLYQAGMMPQLSQDVLGVLWETSLSPLITGSYLLLVSPLERPDHEIQVSTLHQASVRISTGNDSEATVSLLLGEGKKGGIAPVSAFGSVPARLTVQWAGYF